MPSPPAEAHDVEIDDLTPAGDGTARVGSRRVIVPFTIPGERVRIVIRRSGALVIGTLVAVLRPSEHRINPRCSHFGPDAAPEPCGGCSWQHIAYPEQLRLKTAIVERLVRRGVPAAPPVRPMLAATASDDPWGYRQKVHFLFGNVREAEGYRTSLVLGHHARGSRRIVPIRECPVHDPRGNALAFRMRDRYARAGVNAVGGSASGTLRGLAIRVGLHTAEMMATLVITAEGDRRLRSTTAGVLSGEPPTTAFHLNLHSRSDPFIFGRETRRLSGAERMREVVAGATFLASPTAFFQTNVAAAEILVRLVAEAIPRQARVLDLYAGAGLFAIPLALAGHTVTAVEENRAAVADGIASARLNRLDGSRCRFISRRVEHLSGIAMPDVVVLDPPREGCAPGVIRKVFGVLRPPLVAYISCNPEALAIDLQAIVDHGYDVRSIQPVDMFPHTAHIETVVIAAR